VGGFLFGFSPFSFSTMENSAYNQITVVKTTIGEVSTSVITLNFLDTLVLLSILWVFWVVALKPIFKKRR
jgi:hypothetical protein